jgi:streptogramin lyase
VRTLTAVVIAGALGVSVSTTPAVASPSIGSSSPPPATGMTLATAGIGAGVAPGTVTEAPLGGGQIYLFGVTAGPDGNLWFADQGCIGLGRCAIGRLSADGLAVLFERGLNPGSVPFSVAAGADGNVWFTDDGRRPAIGRITRDGRITEFSRGLRRGSQPFELTLGRDGAVWFTDQGSRPAIGRISRRGAITEFSRGLPHGSVPFGIATATDGRVWFTDRGCSGAGRCGVGRLASSGQIAEVRQGLRAGGQPLGIAAGADGAMWFADSTGAVGQVNPAGRIIEHTRGLRSGSSPVAVAPGPDGNIWFTDEGQAPAVGRLTPHGAIREFSAGVAPGSEPAAITPAADGRLWFTDEGSSAALGTVATGEPAAVRSLPRIAAAPRPGTAARCRPGRFATWAELAPSPAAQGFDGFRWLRDGVALPGHIGQSFTPAPRDAGARLACRETVTYPPPLNVTVAVISPQVRIRGASSIAASLQLGLSA